MAALQLDADEEVVDAYAAVIVDAVIEVHLTPAEAVVVIVHHNVVAAVQICSSFVASTRSVANLLQNTLK